MTLRSLPALPAISMRSGIGTEIMPSALNRWQPDIRAAASDEEDNTISILDVIGADVFGDGVTSRRISSALRSIGDQEVVVNINSPGGDFMEGLAIYNLLRDHRQKVTVRVLGLAASAASIIAMAGDRIEVPRAGFLMIHNTWVMAIGDRNDLSGVADILKSFDQASAEVYAARSGLDSKSISAMMDRETWLTGSAAVEKGLADDLLPADRISKEEKASAEHAVNAAARLDVLLAKAGLPRSERRALLNDYKSGMQIAADDVTQNADESLMREALAALASL